MSKSTEKHGPLVLDLDDFTGDGVQLVDLDGLRDEFGEEFQITLFTIPAAAGAARLQIIRDEMPWAKLVPHGFLHLDSLECAGWDGAFMEMYLTVIAGLGLEHGFKAPGWQINTAIYRVLANRGYWVADHVTNRPRRPLALPAYELDEPRKIHGHFGHMGGYNANELSLILPAIRQAVRGLEEKRQAGLYSGPLFGLCGQELRCTGEA